MYSRTSRKGVFLITKARSSDSLLDTILLWSRKHRLSLGVLAKRAHQFIRIHSYLGQTVLGAHITREGIGGRTLQVHTFPEVRIERVKVGRKRGNPRSIELPDIFRPEVIHDISKHL